LLKICEKRFDSIAMKEDLIYVSHILTAIADIKEFTGKMNKKDFFKNKMAEHAVVRNIEVIGEASKHLSAVIR